MRGRLRALLAGCASVAVLAGSMMSVPGVASAVDSTVDNQVAAEDPAVMIPPVCVPADREVAAASIAPVWPELSPLGVLGADGEPVNDGAWFAGDDTVASVAPVGVTVEGIWRSAAANT